MSQQKILLQKFKVKGYKNLSHFVTFGPLGQINVIHGPNNVGKSNLLQAMDLFFRLQQIGSKSGKEKLVLRQAEFEELGHPVNQIFNLADPTTPIELIATFSFTPEQQEEFKLERLYDYPIRISLQYDNAIEIKYPIAFSDMPLKAWLKLFPRSFNRIFRGEQIINPFVLLGVNRRMMIDDSTPPSLQIAPQQLRDALFDAKEAHEAEAARRWELFVEVMQEFEDILGTGQFNTAFDRQSNKANLVFDQGDVRIPIDLLGSGIQQIIALLGQLILAPAIMIGIEEPELNLRYPLQKRLLAAFKKIIQSTHGPSQLFLTSHSPAFEAEEAFFAMEMKNNIPTLTKKPRNMAWIQTGIGKGEEDKYAEMYAKLPEPVNFVSSEGLVLLPQKTRERLNLKDGGGISFIFNKNTDCYEIWTTEELDHWLSKDSEFVDAGEGEKRSLQTLKHQATKR